MVTMDIKQFCQYSENVGISEIFDDYEVGVLGCSNSGLEHFMQNNIRSSNMNTYELKDWLIGCSQYVGYMQEQKLIAISQTVPTVHQTIDSSNER